MRDSTPRDPDDALAFQAYLYAGGELDGPEEAAFERRLGDDPAAREALCQAVRLSAGLGGRPPAVPGPAFRECVRRRLRRGPGGRKGYPGHPALWGALGAAAAVLAMAGL